MATATAAGFDSAVTVVLAFIVVVTAAFLLTVYRPMQRELMVRREWVIFCNTPGCSHLATMRISQESALPRGAVVRWRDVCQCHVEWGNQNLDLTEREDLASLLPSR